MGHYRKQEVDFIIRTKEIIRQYDEYIPKEEETHYNVTLFINCMIGLLIIPQQYWYEHLPKTEINEEDWGIHPDMIRYSNNGKTIQSVATHLRNSITHYRFQSLPNTKDILEDFDFKDYNQKKEQTFEAILQIKAIRKFVAKLTEEFLRSMENEK